MASRPAEGDDQDRRRQRRTEVEQVLLQHPDIVQAFVVGIPEIVARQSSCGAGCQRIRWLAETCPESHGAAAGDRGSCAAARKAGRAGTL